MFTHKMIDFEKVCRTCAKEEKELLLLFKNKEVPTMLMEIASISMAENDGFPSHICNRCVNQMHAAISFKNQCIEANNKFLSYLQTNKVFIKSEQPSEENVKNTNEYSLHYSENCIKSEIFADNLKPLVSSEENSDDTEVCNKTVETGSVHILQKTKTKDNDGRVKGKLKRENASGICNKKANGPYMFKKRINVHSNEKPFQCHICGMRLSNRYNVNRHLKIHSGEKPYICEFCGKQFIQHPALVLHLKSHNKENSRKMKQNREKYKRSKINNENRERPFKCKTCDKSFVSKNGLQWHQIGHGEKKFVCSECGKAFSYKLNLEQHLRVHTGERPFECQECKKCFGQEAALVRHMRIHTGEKPFVCQSCGKSFRQKPHLNSHMLQHTGEKPYACTFCNKRFTANLTLKIHTRMHTGEKPYVCSICDKKFYNSSSLKKHMLTHKHL